MILTCPECATRYQTDAANFVPDGRKVRCAKCGHVWFQAAPQPEAEQAVEDESVTTAATAEAPVIPQRDFSETPALAATEAGRAPVAERMVLGVGWAVLGFVLVGIGWSTFHYRQDIAGLWPQSASFYKAIGATVNTRGIEIETSDRQAHFETEDDQQVLVITGSLVNITSRELSVPPIRVSLMDEGKRELYHWSFEPGVATLHAGQSIAFRTRLPNPPTAMKHIELNFAQGVN
jgi:predicted Zn finger-like uncharacterized protein